MNLLPGHGAALILSGLSKGRNCSQGCEYRPDTLAKPQSHVISNLKPSLGISISDIVAVMRD